jgi:AcrR family transcriptional regulator
MRIITARGFAEVTISQMASELHCSASSLYRIASSKDSLVVLAITHWGHHILEDMEVRAHRGNTAADRARLYLRAGVETVRPLSPEFRSDVGRFESARLAYATISDRFQDRFVELLDDAVQAGEIKSMNTRFLAHVLRQMAFVVRDEQFLSSCGLTAAQALNEIDRIIWDGINSGRSSAGRGIPPRKSRKKRRHHFRGRSGQGNEKEMGI